MSSNVGKFKRVHREVNLNNGLFTDSASIYRLKATIPTELEVVDAPRIVVPDNVGSHLVLNGTGLSSVGIQLPEKATNGQIIYIVNKTNITVAIVTSEIIPVP